MRLRSLPFKVGNNFAAFHFFGHISSRKIIEDLVLRFVLRLNFLLTGTMAFYPHFQSSQLQITIVRL